MSGSVPLCATNPRAQPPAGQRLLTCSKRPLALRLQSIVSSYKGAASPTDNDTFLTTTVSLGPRPTETMTVETMTRIEPRPAPLQHGEFCPPSWLELWFWNVSISDSS